MTLDTRNAQMNWLDNEKRNYTGFTNNTAYRYYRINITVNNGNASYTTIGEMELFTLQHNNAGHFENVSGDTVSIGSGNTAPKVRVGSRFQMEDKWYIVSDIVGNGAAESAVKFQGDVQIGTYPVDVIYGTGFGDEGASSAVGEFLGVKYTADIATSGSASASNYTNASYIPSYAFDDNNVTSWLVSTTTTSWLQYDLGSGNEAIVYEYSIRDGYDVTANPKDWTFQGSLDGNTWVTLDTRNAQMNWLDNEKRNYTGFTNNTAYRYYRINITVNNGNASYTTIGEMELFKKTLGNYTGAYVTTITNQDGLDSTNWTDINSADVTEDPNSQDIYYALSFTNRSTFTIWTGSVWRTIASKDPSVHGVAGDADWYYRNNASTWSKSGIENNANSAISKAVQYTNNQMTGTELEDISDSDWEYAGGFTTSQTMFDVATTFYSDSDAQNPSINRIRMNFDTNGYTSKTIGEDYEVFQNSATGEQTLTITKKTEGTATVIITTASATGGSNPGVTSFTALTDTPANFSANRILFTNATATALIDDASFTYDGSNLHIGGSLTLGHDTAACDMTKEGSMRYNDASQIMEFCNGTSWGAFVAGSPSAGSATSTQPYLLEGSWVNTSATLPAVLSASQTVVIGDYIYLFGGLNATTATNIIYRAPVTDPTNWANTGATLPGNLYSSQVAVIGDYVYLFGGHNGTSATNVIYRAPLTNPTTWVNTGAILPGNLMFSQLAIIGSYVYLFGGSTGSATNVIYRASIADPTAWVNTGSTLPGNLSYSHVAVIGDYVYLFGGYNAGALNVIYRAPVSAPTSWINTGSVLPNSFDASQLAIIGNSIYLFGGFNGTTALSAIYRASTENPTSWTTASSGIPAALLSSQSAIIGNDIYLFGGSNIGSTLATSSAIYRAEIKTDYPSLASMPNWKTRYAESAGTELFTSAIWDDDGDTGIQTEKNADDDTLRFTIAGSEKMYINSAGNLTPSTNNTISLGSSTNRWKDLYLNSNSLHIGTDGNEVTLSYNETTQTLETNRAIKTASSIQLGNDTAGCSITKEGSMRYNNTTKTMEFCDGTDWGALAAGSGGGIDQPTLLESSWVNTGSTLPGNLMWSQSVIIGEYNYLFGGYTANNTVGNVIYRSPISDPTSWTNTGSVLPGSLAASQAAVIGDYVYLFGGYTGSAATNIIYRAPINNPTAWVNTGMMIPGNLYRSQLAIVDDYVYLFGGHNGTAATNIIYSASISDPTVWTNTGSVLPGNLFDSQSVVIGDYIYLFGGSTGSVTNVIYRASVSSPTTWVNTNSTLPINLSASQVAVIGDYLYLVGGYTTAYANVIYRTSVSNPTLWTNVNTVLPGNLGYSQTAIIGNHIYLFGGESTGTTPRNLIYRAEIKSDYPSLAQNPSWKTRYSTNGSGSTTSLSSLWDLDNDTGIQVEESADEDMIRFDTNGTEKMRIDSLGNLTPSTNNTISLGSSTNRWKDLYLNSNSLHIGTDGNEVILSYNETTQTLETNRSIKTASSIQLGNDTAGCSITKEGSMRYNNTTKTMEFCDGTDWGALAAGSGGGIDQPTLLESSWVNAGSTLPNGIVGGHHAIIGDYIYLFGGHNGTVSVSTIYRAPVSNPTSWTNTGSVLPGNLYQGQLAIIGDYVYIFGGNNGSVTNVIYRAPVTNPTAWVNTGTTIPSALATSNVAVIGGYVYLFGGYTGSAYTNVIYRAPVTNPTAWVNTGSILPGAYQSKSLIISGDYLYLFGGWNGTSANVIYRAPVSNPTSWSNTGSTLPISVHGQDMVVVGDYIYMFGGYTTATVNTIYRAPVSNPTSWSNTNAILPVNLYYQSMFVSGNYIFLLGGSTSWPTALNTIYRAEIKSDYPSLAQNPSWKTRYSTNGSGSTTSLSSLWDLDSDTGIQVEESADEDMIRFDTNGTEKMRIDSLGNLTPSTNNTISLGSSTNRWKDLYLNSNSLHIGTDGNEVTLSYNETTQTLETNRSIKTASSIQLGNDTAGCSITKEGSMRYNNTTKTMEFCDGTDWGALAAGSGGGIDQPTLLESSWVNVGTIAPGALHDPQMVVIGDYIYLFGGSNGASNNTIYRAAVSNPDVWVNTGAVIPGPLYHSQSAIIGDYVYLFGGYTGTAATNVIYRAPITNPTAWVNTGNTLPSNLYGSQLAVIGDYVYLFGGGNPAISNIIYRAPITNPTAWVNTGSVIPGAVHMHRLLVIGEYMYIFGGHTGSASMNIIYKAPVSSPTTWVNTGSVLPVSIHAQEMAVIGDYLYMFAGNTTVAVNTIYRAPVSNPIYWENTNALTPGATHYQRGGIFGNRIYLFGGSAANVIYRAEIKSDYPSLAQNPSWKTRYSTNGSGSTTSLSSLWDLDSDTGIQVEESVDEDMIRFDTNGTEKMRIDSLGNLTPSTNNTISLGSSTNRWKDLYLNSNSLHIGTDGNEVILSYNETTQTLETNRSIKTASSIQLGNDTAGCSITKEGSMRYNNTTKTMEFCDGTDWGALAAGSGGGIDQPTLLEDSWVNTTATLPTTLYQSQTAVIGDYVYLFGGYGATITNAIYRAPITNPTAWVNTGSVIPSNLYNSQIAVIGDYIYLFGGQNPSTTNTIFRAPISNPTAWTNTGATLPGALDGSQVAVIGSYVYLFGGYNGSAYTNVIYRAPVSDPTAWVNTGSVLPSALRASQVAVIGDYVYLFGGHNGSAVVSTIFRAPVSNPTAWVNTNATLPGINHWAQVAIIGDYVYLFGGHNGAALNSIFRAPVSSPTSWVNTTSVLPTTMYYAQPVTIIGNNVYLFGGYNASGPTNLIYRAEIKSDYPSLAQNPSWKTRYSTNGSGSTTSLSSLWDLDSDTGIQVEESADEDMIRFDTNGTEKMRIDSLGNLTPSTNNTISLGSSTNRWKDLYLNSNSLHIGTDGNEVTLSYNETTQTLETNRSIKTLGSIQLGDDASACSITKEGAMKYNNSTKVMEFCDGTTWSVFGGATSSGVEQPTLLESSFVSAGTTLPTNLGQSQTAVIGDYIYLFGGRIASVYTNVIYRAPVTNPTAWTNTGATLPGNLGISQIAVIGDYAYLFGGYNGSAFTNVIYRAPITNPLAWTNTGATIPGNLAYSQIAVIGDYAYLFGGYNGSTYLNVIYRAPVTNPTAWTNTGATLPGNLGTSQIAVIGDYVYLFGGYNGTAVTNVIYKAPISNPTAWTNTGSTLPISVHAHEMAVIGNYIYLYGGNTTAAVNTIYRASVNNPTNWTDTRAVLPGVLHYSQSAIIGNYIYLFGGINASADTNVIYRAQINNSYPSLAQNPDWKTRYATSGSGSESTVSLTSLWDDNADTGIQVEESADEDMIRFDTNGTQRMFISEIGNIGIGTTTLPTTAKLQITSAASNASNTLFTTNDYALNTTGSSLAIDFGTTSGNTYTQLSAKSAGGSAWNNLVLQGGGGNVGIGTTTPSALLDLQKAGTAKSNLDILELTNSANAADMDTTQTSILFNQYYYDATTPAVADSARLTVGAEQDWTSTATTQDSFMSFATALDGALSEKVRITSGGNMGLGTGTPGATLDIASLIGSNTPGLNHKLRFSYGGTGLFGWRVDSGNATLVLDSFDYSSVWNPTISVLRNVGYVGIGTASPTQKLTVYNGSTTGTYTTTGWVHSSDERLKTNIASIDDPLQKVLQLDDVYFNWKANPNSDRQIGFIAQDVQKIIPEVVVGNDKDGYGISYGNITALLVGAMQEQNTLIETNTNDLTTKATATSLADLQNMTDAQFTETSEILKQVQDDTLELQQEANTQSNILTQIQLDLTELQAGIDMLTTLGTIDALKLSELLAIDPNTLLIATEEGDLTITGIMTTQQIITDEIETKKFTINDDVTTKDENDEEISAASVGTATIPAHETETTVETAAITDTSRVFVTARGDEAVDVTLTVTDIKDGMCTVRIPEEKEQEVIFDWFVVSGKE